MEKDEMHNTQKPLDETLLEAQTEAVDEAMSTPVNTAPKQAPATRKDGTPYFDVPEYNEEIDPTNQVAAIEQGEQVAQDQESDYFDESEPAPPVARETLSSAWGTQDEDEGTETLDDEGEAYVSPEQLKAQKKKRIAILCTVLSVVLVVLAVVATIVLLNVSKRARLSAAYQSAREALQHYEIAIAENPNMPADGTEVPNNSLFVVCDDHGDVYRFYYQNGELGSKSNPDVRPSKWASNPDVYRVFTGSVATRDEELKKLLISVCGLSANGTAVLDYPDSPDGRLPYAAVLTHTDENGKKTVFYIYTVPYYTGAVVIMLGSSAYHAHNFANGTCTVCGVADPNYHAIELSDSDLATPANANKAQAVSTVGTNVAQYISALSYDQRGDLATIQEEVTAILEQSGVTNVSQVTVTLVGTQYQLQFTFVDGNTYLYKDESLNVDPALCMHVDVDGDEYCDKCGVSLYTNGLQYSLMADDTYSVSGYTGKSKKVYIPGRYLDVPVTAIYSGVFNGKDITYITLPSSITYIEGGAFADCDTLSSIAIPAGVTEIGSNAFANCSALTSITVDKNNPVYHSTGNCIIETASNTLIVGCKTSVIPTDGSVTIIGDSAFARCSTLASIDIPDTIVTIGTYAFYGCRELADVTLPTSLTTIGNMAFSDCDGFTSIAIPAGVTTVGGGVFDGCYELTSITVDENNPVYHSAGNCIIETASNTLIAGCKTSVVPTDGSVTSIGNYAFSGCSELTSITIPDSVTTIGDYAFFGCLGLTSITIPDSVIYIGDSAFSWCYNAETIFISNSVTSIGDYAFHNCFSITSITFPASVTTLGRGVLGSCNYLTTIRYDGTMAQWAAIAKEKEWDNDTPDYDLVCADGKLSKAEQANLPQPTECQYHVDSNGDDICDKCGQHMPTEGLQYETIYNGTYSVSGYKGTDTEVYIPATVDGVAVTYISSSAFLHYDNVSNPNNNLVTRVHLPDSIVGISTSAFYGCANLVEINLPDGLTTLNVEAFASCASLSYIEIPGGVTTLGSQVFDSCGALERVVLRSGVATISDKAFAFCVALNYIEIPATVQTIGRKAFNYCTALATIYYGGTMAQWQAITKVAGWDDGTSDYAVCCADGYLAKDGTAHVTEGLQYTVLSDGTYSVSGYTGTDAEVYIPAIFEGKAVTEIGAGAFFDKSITSVYIPNSVTTIRSGAFSWCEQLTAITIPASVTTIESDAFSRCNSLVTIVVQDGNPVYHSAGNCIIETASKTLIAGCNASVIPNDGSVTAIGGHAFSQLLEITSISIPPTVTSIGDNAFYHCSSLASITIPASVNWIGNTAFFGCSALSSIVVEEGNATYHSAGNCLIDTENKTLKQGCKTSVIPTDGSVTAIGFCAFYGYSDLEAIVIPNGIESIGHAAFWDCVSLTSIIIPATVKTIESIPFMDCKALTSIVVAEGNPVYHSAGNCLIETASKTLIAGCKTSVIPTDGSVTAIEQGAFMGCDELTSIVIPASVTSIGSSAFCSCSGLTSIAIPDGVETIGSQMFGFCYGLTRIAIPSSVTYLAQGVFDNCGSLDVIDFGGTMAQWTSIIRETNWDDGTPDYVVCCADGYLSKDGTAHVTEGLQYTLLDGGTYSVSGYTGTDAAVYIPVTYQGKPVTAVGDGAFDNRSGITAITIPLGVTYIGASAFNGCSGLTSIAIPSSVDVIYASAFNGCSGLTSITVANGNATYHSAGNCIIHTSSKTLVLGCKTSVIPTDVVTSIGGYAFAGCSELTAINIPASVTSIGDYAFYDCGVLVFVTFAKGSQLTAIGNDAFSYCSGLTSITIPAGVASIGGYAFAGCSGLTSITIPAGVATIGDGAFDNCSALAEIHYGGTMAQWQALSKGSYWDSSTPDYLVRCTDGTWTKDGQVYEEQVTCDAHVDADGDEMCDNCGEHMPTDGLAFALLEGGTYSVSGYAGTDTEVYIPATYNGKAVTSIGTYAFCNDGNIYTNNNEIVAVHIPDSVNSIGDHAFRECSGLTSITIPDSVTTIGHYAFYYCSGLTSITIPEGVIEIRTGAFQGCRGLTSITIPASVKTIESDPFLDCKALTSIVVVEGNPVYHSAGNCLIDTDNKTLIQGCKTSVIPIDGSVTYIGLDAFCGCSELTSITIPEGVISIGNYAFEDCSGLTSVTIPSGVIYIGTGAFSYCSGLTSITIPASVTSIEIAAFRGCDALTEIDYGCTIEQWRAITKGEDWDNGTPDYTVHCTDGDLAKDGHQHNYTTVVTAATCGTDGYTTHTCSACAYSYMDNYVPATGDHVPGGWIPPIAATCSTAGRRDFYRCDVCDAAVDIDGKALSDEDLVVPPSGEHTYVNDVCSLCGAHRPTAGLVYTLLGDDTYSISGYEGSGTIVYIPATYNGKAVTEIGDRAFRNDGNTYTNNNGIVEVHIPDSVTSIGNSVFNGCSGLTSITVDENNPVYHSANNCLIETASKTLIAGCKTSVIPTDGSVTGIWPYAFGGCSGLTSITIPDSVTSIGWGAFEICYALASINIPEGVTSIEDYAFDRCSGLTSVTIGNGVTSIGSSAFRDCSGLTSITIGNGVTTIGDQAFYGCSGLTSVTIGSGVKSIGRYAFSCCSKLTSVTIPDSVTTIGDYAFSGCSGLTTITIPESVTYIGVSAFSHCSGLTAIHYGGTVAQWQAITKGEDWDLDTADYNVHCLDGDVAKDGHQHDYNVTVVEPTCALPGQTTYACTLCPYSYQDNYHPATGLHNYVDGACTVCGGLRTSGLSFTLNGNVYRLTGYEGNADVVYVPALYDGKYVTAIGGGAFWQCSTIGTLYIPDRVTTIGEIAMRDCSALAAIYYDGTMAQWQAITKGENWDYGTPEYIVYCTDGALDRAGNVIGEHIHIYTGEWLWDETYHWHDCAGEGDCDAPKADEAIHTYGDDITATAYYTCSVCGYTNNTRKNEYLAAQQPAHDHDYSEDWSYDANTHWHDCTGEGDCDEPQGDLAAHTYDDVVTPPTCTEQGYTTHTCTVCGHSYVDTYVAATGHNFEDGVCTGCGEHEPTAGLVYTLLGNGTYCVTDYTGTDTAVYIPATYEGKAVTEIGYEAFRSCKNLTSISIPATVTTIGDYAFAYCSGLASISIPADVTFIGDYAFSGCSGLTDITIPDRVASIGAWAFAYCSGLTSITIPASVTSIGGGSAFAYCSGLTSVTVVEGNSVYHSVANCIIETETKTLVLGCKNSVIPTDGSVTSVGASALRGSSGMASISIPSCVTNIGNYAFAYCSELADIYYDGTMAQWNDITKGTSWNYETGDYTVQCSDGYVNKSGTQLVTEGLQYTLLEGDTYSVSGYTGTDTAVYIPATYQGKAVTRIGLDAFAAKQVTLVRIPSSVSTIEDSAFINCSSLISINIPVGVTEIRGGVFSGCSSLTAIILPDGVTSIGSGAFSGCISLASINIPEGVTYIDWNAFCNCSNLTEVTLPASLIEIGEYAFNDCVALATISVDTDNPVYYSEGNCLVETASGTLLFGCKTSIIPEGVTVINGSSFYGCSGLTSIAIPASVTTIGSDAFYGCSGLTSFACADGSGLSFIGSFAFEECTGLTTVAIPSSLTAIGAGAFNGCTNIEEIHYSGDIAGWCAIENLSELMAFGKTTKSLYINGAKIENDLTIPSGVTSIGSFAFYGCSNLTTITIPASVTSIESYAFSSCSGLTSIYYGGTMAQWAAIEKGQDWDKNTPDYIVHCSDGDLDKDGNPVE